MLNLSLASGRARKFSAVWILQSHLGGGTKSSQEGEGGREGGTCVEEGREKEKGGAGSGMGGERREA